MTDGRFAHKVCEILTHKGLDGRRVMAPNFLDSHVKFPFPNPNFFCR
jgi:hypothetical protein